jgi:hypothetical protein
LAVQLDQVGARDRAEIGPGASLVDAEERVERFEGTAMDVEGVGQELADGRASAGVVDGLGVAGPEQPVVGQSAGARVAAEGTLSRGFRESCSMRWARQIRRRELR